MIFNLEFVAARTRKLLLAGTALAGAALFPSFTGQSVWGGGGSSTTTTDYNLGTNWSNPPPGAPPVNAGQAAQFGNVGSTTIVITAGPITPNFWHFISRGYTISGQAVNFNGAGLNFANDAGAGQTISISNNMTGAEIDQSAAGTLALSGTNSFTTTSVTAGTLINNGSLTGTITSNATFTNNGTTIGAFTLAAGTLTGSGNTSNLTASGGTFAPGNGTAGSFMTVTGSLVMQAAATYLVQVNPTTASFTNVTGAATLNGATVSANYAAGSYIAKRYTILTAAVGVTGTFGGVTATGQPANMNSTLSYDANNAYLNLNLNFGLPGVALNQNQQNVGNALTRFFNRTGGIPMAFASLTAGQLTQSDGEAATGSQQTTFNAMNQFMGVMTDPFIAGRGDAGIGRRRRDGLCGRAAIALCSKTQYERSAGCDLYQGAASGDLRATLERVGGGLWRFADHQRQRGVGCNTTTSNVYGTAVGADYRVSPDTLAGFAIAGGGTKFPSPRISARAAPICSRPALIRHNIGAAYLSGALAYGWQDVTTNRTLTIAGIERLRRNSTPTRGRAARRRLPLRVAGDGLDAVCRGPVHHLRPAGLCRTGRRRRQHVCARLCAQERDRNAQ